VSEGKIIEIYNQGISQVIDAIQKLTIEIRTQKAEIEALCKENKFLTKRVLSLESQVNKNSNKRYSKLLKDGFDEDYIANSELYAEKKVKRSTSLNLLNRLSAYKEQILTFMYDFNIPFDNNLAERDLRMTKVKQKISGTFRSVEGANSFTRTRGYVSTVRKNGLNTLDCIMSIFTSNPVDPTLV